VTGFLRFIGILSAGVLFGVAIFYTFGIRPAAYSHEMQQVLKTANYPYYSEAIAEIYRGRYFFWQMLCAILAFLHLFVEWLYLGKSPRKLWLGVLIGLFWVLLVEGYWIEPKLKDLHALRYASGTPKEQREAANSSFEAWRQISQVFNLLVVCGVPFYLWRVATPSDPARFVSANKFRS
jgi:hypothetical protein